MYQHSRPSSKFCASQTEKTKETNTHTKASPNSTQTRQTIRHHASPLPPAHAPHHPPLIHRADGQRDGAAGPDAPTPGRGRGGRRTPNHAEPAGHLCRHPHEHSHHPRAGRQHHAVHHALEHVGAGRGRSGSPGGFVGCRCLWCARRGRPRGRALGFCNSQGHVLFFVFAMSF